MAITEDRTHRPTRLPTVSPTRAHGHPKAQDSAIFQQAAPPPATTGATGGGARRAAWRGAGGASVAPDEQMGGQSHRYGQISDNRARLVERTDPNQIAMDGKGDAGARNEAQLSKRCE